jgi:predicted nucleic acid-binding protein
MKPNVPDTDVVSYLFKSDSRAVQYMDHLNHRQWLISFMTEAELEQWVLLSNLAQKRVEWIRIYLLRFVIVPSSRDLVVKWAEVMVSARRDRRRIETTDAWVAATAILYRAPLATHNTSDYAGVEGLELITGLAEV